MPFLQPRIELDPGRRIQISELIRSLDDDNSPKKESEDSDFMRRYKQNLFDNISAGDGSGLQQFVNEELVQINTLDESLQKELDLKQLSPSYQRMMGFREKLPAFQHRKQFLKLIEENQVIVISGETGYCRIT